MKTALAFLLACIALATPLHAICTGAMDCKECADCSSCAHCAKGAGFCGVNLAALRKQAPLPSFAWIARENLNLGSSESPRESVSVRREIERQRDGRTLVLYFYASESSLRISRGDRTESKKLLAANRHADAMIVSGAELRGDPSVFLTWADVQSFAAALAKVVEWEKIARENSAEPIRKPLGEYMDGTVAFVWEPDYVAAVQKPGAMRGVLVMGAHRLDAADCAALLDLLRAELPAARKEIAERKAKREKEAALFK